jgi:uncharacterized protein (DUF2141 family)
MWLPRRVVLSTALVLFQIAPIDCTRAEETNAAGTLTVLVQGLTTSDGDVRFVLFDSKKNFLKHPVRAGVIDIVDQQSSWTVEDLPYGIYAVLVHHDINSSGTMERHWYGKPKEPTGASNNAPARFGPPKFKKAKFAFESSTLTLTITVN